MMMTVEQYVTRQGRLSEVAAAKAPKKPAAPRQDHEHKAQVELFKWANSATIAYPDLKWLFAIPNGGKRSKATAGRIKAEGGKKGVLDIFLPTARAGWHGLFIEMKHGRNRPTDEQIAFMADMPPRGYLCYVCYSAKAARDCLLAYLDGAPVIGVEH